MQFFEANEFIFEASLDLKTAFYTLSFEKVKNIIEGLKKWINLQAQIIISTINLYISKKIINLNNMTYSLI